VYSYAASDLVLDAHKHHDQVPAHRQDRTDARQRRHESKPGVGTWRTYNPIIAYLGVVPAHRGHGHINDVLAAGTSLLAAQNVPRIRATTDVGNAPMAAAFARTGYVTCERQIDMTWRESPSQVRGLPAYQAN
jgi:hypothetical protein